MKTLETTYGSWGALVTLPLPRMIRLWCCLQATWFCRWGQEYFTLPAVCETQMEPREQEENPPVVPIISKEAGCVWEACRTH